MGVDLSYWTSVATIAVLPVYGVLHWLGIVRFGVPPRSQSHYACWQFFRGRSPLRWIGIGGGLLIFLSSSLFTGRLGPFLAVQWLGFAVILAGLVLLFTNPRWALPAWLKNQ